MNTIKDQEDTLTISFKAELFKINSWTILRLPEDASARLPSRGMTMVSGTMNGVPFKALLEPDGRYAPGQQSSHWFSPDKKLLDAAGAVAGDSVEVSMEPSKEWIEPEVPEDLKEALSTSPKAEALWEDITPLARWDWIRWIRAVKTAETRQKHIEVALDKLNKGMRRPCCFNRNLCSEPYVSKNWALLEPTQ
ncbi:MAG TPA: YdeI/OmpD-associated family protein [Promineifilum sp.]|nr:YdeI/OmpD-associated family protein [Promineifilum sp.]HRO24392.1 YdeI/OmpD-associated family protein [Promineifilum sp.]HRO90586.1 YdeI/OmpD-associated family protein [Promineifilum sp.]HRQ12813.1 YdeI/OmpD-associated family protein [Promineifilum sp.]